MTSAEAINIYLKQIILNSGIPFEIKMPQFSDEMLEHPEKYKSYDSVEEFMEALHNES